jgi:hypothetical protein
MERTRAKQKPRVYVSADLLEYIERRAKKNKRTKSSEAEYLLEIARDYVERDNHQRQEQPS